MLRIEGGPRRPDWQQLVRNEGLVYLNTTTPAGQEVPYWREDVRYEITADEARIIEEAGKRLFQMFVGAGEHIIQHNLFHKLGIPEWAIPAIAELWKDAGDKLDPARPGWYTPMLYGRFDLCPVRDKDGRLVNVKLYEYNAAEPTGMVETSITQWNWLLGNHLNSPTTGQFNSLWEGLVEGWVHEIHKFRKITGRRLGRIHVAYSSGDKSGEDAANAAFMHDVICAASEQLVAAGEGGVEAKLIWMHQIGEEIPMHNGVPTGIPRYFDPDGLPVEFCFKLWPWEWMLQEPYGRGCIDNMLDPTGTVWVEPIWKMMWSNKGILPILWELYGDTQDGELLVPAYFEGEEPPGFAANAVRKVLHGREGANVTITVNGVVIANGPKEGYDGDDGIDGPAILQEYCPLPKFYSAADSMASPNGKVYMRPVLGVWTVQGGVLALIIRESPNKITNNTSFATPHVVTDLKPE